MRSLLFALLIVFVSTTAFAQKETRKVDDFTYVSFGVPGKLYIKEGSRSSVELEGNDIDEIETEVRNGRLIIKKEGKWNWGSSDRITAYVTVEKLEGLNVSGSGNAIGEGTFETDELDLGVSGSGEIELDVDAGDIETSISGSGDIYLEGDADYHRVSISGSGKLDAEDMVAEKYKISISGSGTCRINVEKEIDAKVSGSGNVYYRGNPDKVYHSASGSGKIRKID